MNTLVYRRGDVRGTRGRSALVIAASLTRRLMRGHVGYENWF